MRSSISHTQDPYLEDVRSCKHDQDLDAIVLKSTNVLKKMVAPTDSYPST